MGNKLSSLMPWRPKTQSHSITFIYGGQINSETFLSTLQAHKDYLKAGSPRTYTREENGSTIITFQRSKPFRTANEDKLERTVMEILGLSGNNGTLTKLAISTKTT
ncbi:hypothetical protein I204_07304 [Kwoniella mangroviensis CBS 8886]|uniref:hypothetical protein n=1 Tax=Kwoniella mangroviensis CBS 8507 TaxID=1296122 RepID=UPI00080D4C7C|nr:uncharacterized protein I203_04902 [Kwoniella mangroviensis CBS 8507]OCF65882.1 hypothetical protein I203_04902 [Kwoniella mangroviensis CBS 8507]OCF72040.1 hypothetical protein I204_07304 [Kwoniella mangroviensis CBS 8886]